MLDARIRNAGLLGLLVVAFALAACGGEDAPSDKLSAYVDGFETARVQLFDETRDLPGIGAESSLSDARRTFNEVAAAQQRRVTSMERLDPPATLVEFHDELLEAMRELLDFSTRVRDRVAAMTEQAELAQMAVDQELGIENQAALQASFDAACSRLQREAGSRVELSCDSGE